MNIKRAKITILPNGDVTFKAIEGFAGEQCISQTAEILNIIGGETLAEGKTDDYFSGQGDFVSENIFNGQ